MSEKFNDYMEKYGYKDAVIVENPTYDDWQQFKCQHPKFKMKEHYQYILFKTPNNRYMVMTNLTYMAVKRDSEERNEDERSEFNS